MRHAKSSWRSHRLRDFDRPLNKRGENDAPKMGRYLKELKLVPDQIFCSPAARAKSTISLVLQEFNLPTRAVTWNEELYYDGAEAYINTIRNADDESEIVMTVGHNPMTEDVISILSGHTADKVIKTATVACFEFEADSWKNIRFGAEALKWIIAPKDLKK